MVKKGFTQKRSRRVTLKKTSFLYLSLFVMTMLSLGFLFQGCTLLFVSKGETRYVENKTPQTPPAPSLSRQMNKTVVLKYKVQEGDTFQSIAAIYYGVTSKASKVASANHLSLKSKLKEGKVLRIVDPVNFPNPKELVKKKPTAQTTTETPKPGPISQLDTTPENITQVPRPKKNYAFGPGEKLTFEVKALSMVGGYGTLEIGNPVTVQDRPCYPLSAKATAAFPFSMVYQVHDVQTSYFDVVDFLTWKFENDVLEGKHKAQNLEIYDQVKHKVVRSKGNEPPEEIDIAPFTQDIISCFFYFRLLPLEVGKNYSIPAQAAGYNYNLIVEVIKKERITIPSGTYDCLLVKPHVRYATVFRNTDDINIWLTDDQRHLPVLVTSKIFIGNVEATLIEANLPKVKEPEKKPEPRIQTHKRKKEEE
jgi:phage tail protein X